ncbi:MAG: hypothetical protein M1835_002936 [Candelina submexicana]|nr:MAG: hypothetical protein M1835_002936 [Candelina submexicana]
MALARAFTKRTKRPETSQPLPTRAASARHHGQRINRQEISAPLELISTTNMLSYNAPDIRSRSSSTTSGSDSDHSPFSHSSTHSTDASSIESSPGSIEPNHLSGYFKSANGNRSASTGSYRKSNSSSPDAPPIPQRALSHTKATHDALVRSRSQAQTTPPNPIPLFQSLSSVDIFNGNIDPAHPFGKELEQVNELAEEFGVRESVVDETQILSMKGLYRFAAEDYVLEIEGLFGGVFEDTTYGMSVGWI